MGAVPEQLRAYVTLGFLEQAGPLSGRAIGFFEVRLATWFYLESPNCHKMLRLHVSHASHRFLFCNTIIKYFGGYSLFTLTYTTCKVHLGGNTILANIQNEADASEKASFITIWPSGGSKVIDFCLP